MKRSEEHDNNFLKEILLFEPFTNKHASEERGKCWERIAESLNSLCDDELFYKVNQRSIRDRCNYLEKRFKEKVRTEERATGICPEEESEMNQAIRDIMERFRESQETPNVTKSNQNDLAQGKEMRQQSLETYSETLKSKGDEESQTSSKRINTGSETFRFLKDKSDTDRETKQTEINFRREELMVKSRIEEMVNEREREKIRLQQMQVEQQQQLNLAFIYLFIINIYPG